MDQKEYTIGYLTKTVYTSNTNNATATDGDILAGKKAYGTGNELITGTIPTYQDEDALSYIQYHARLRGGNLDYFWYKYNGTEIHIPKGALKGVTSLRYAFSECPNLTAVYVYEDDTKDVVNTDYMFKDANIEEWTTITEPEPAMFKLRKRAIDPWDTVGWSTFNLPNLQVSNNTFKNSRFKNLKIANTAKIKNISNTFRDMPELESLYITDCSNVENDQSYVQSLKCVDGFTSNLKGSIDLLNSKTINQLATAPKLEKLRMSNFKAPTHIRTEVIESLVNVELNDMQNLITCSQMTTLLPNLEIFKLTGVQNLEDISTFTSGGKKLESFELVTDYKSNISIKSFTLNDGIVTNPSASLFAEGNIIYCVETKKYYKNTTINNVKTWKSFTPTEKDLQGDAPYLTIINFQHDTVDALNCMPGMIVYFQPEEKYYKWYKGAWEEVVPTEYPLKQSTYYLRGAEYAFAGATNLKSVRINDASQLGDTLCALGSNRLTGFSAIWLWIQKQVTVHDFNYELNFESPDLDASEFTDEVFRIIIDTEYTHSEEFWESMNLDGGWKWQKHHFFKEPTPLTNMFQGCVNIESIRLPGISRPFSIKDCVRMSRDAIVELLEDLAPVGLCTLELGATNLAKLREEDRKIASDKGWNLA